MRNRFAHIGRLVAAISIVLLGLTALPVAGGAASLPGAIVTYTVVGGEGLHDQVPATFGAVFAKGDVPPGTSVVAMDGAGHILPSQIDVKAKHVDGSLRHAVVTVVVPHLSEGETFDVTLAKGQAAPTQPLNIADLPANFDATVDLSVNG
jgi:hypothetical protein